jgi:alpha-galactosidase
LGLRVALWFEPERVAHGTQIWNEHPNFVHQPSNSGPGSSGLYRLDDPAALKHMTDLLSKLIQENGIDIYRSDFNIDPLPFWRAADAPDRQGMTEIRYVEGLYAMWDELVARKPGLLIDDCASGGRRIDLETLSRAAVMTRSDTACLGGRSEWDQAQSYGLSLYFPTHTTMVWSPDAYICRSGSTNGSVTQFDYLDPKFDLALAKKAVQEIRTNAPYWYGDFHPLTTCSIQPNAWLAFQLHRADLKGGLVMAFRRKECRHEELQVQLEQLDPSATYILEVVDEAYATTKREASGRELMKGLQLRCAAPGSSVVVRYKQTD